MPMRSVLGLGWLLVCLAGCSFLETRTSDEDLQPINTSQLRGLLADKGAAVALVDVRTPGRFAAEHLPGAVNIPLSDMRQGDPRLADARAIVTYSDGWRDYLAPAAAKKLMALGYRNVLDYRGGIDQWKADGHPTVTAP